ncbi:hypothetical protein [Nocardioides sp. Soil805]|uniref:hypothetical protein n=1 Tax=Nocardioides sp. Soil805 TaxID=1736416 RepID=UPI0007034405|nr:hypothetical protein [Nocardioides sp. Soil805]KRF34093.1 hypothetical protein ASG94_15235 [Nocardioides sp. Soil805]
MTRIVLGLVVVLLLSACSSDSGASDTGATGEGSGSTGGLDARSAKSEADTEARSLLPDLVGELGGRLNGMQAGFVERGGFGIWDYTASGSLARPSGTLSQSLATAESVLEEHGYTVETNDAQKRVTGAKDDLSVIVEASLLTAEEKGAGLNLRMGIAGIEDGDDFAGSAPPEDYVAYLG